MGAKFKFLILYWLSWVLLFDLGRTLFLLYHSSKASGASAADIIGTFTHGLRMDLSVSAYILVPVCLFVLLSLIIPYFNRRSIYYIYSSIILFAVLLIIMTDIYIYQAWGFRLDATPLKFLSTPREAIASISHLPLFWITVGFIVVFILIWVVFRKILKSIFFEMQRRFKLLTAVLILVFMAALIIPIRGGLQLAPLNQSSVYFSINNFINHTAINPAWNFLHSVLSKENIRKNPYRYFDKATDQHLVDSLYTGTGIIDTLVNYSANKPVNIVIVIWESFTEKAIHANRDAQEVTPQFNKLRNQGIYFSNLYASGDRTNKGVPAILSGYPAMPNTTIIHSPGKIKQLKSLPGLYKQNGYITSFFYGGEPEFANIKSYLLHCGYNPIIGSNDFEKKDMNSKWGAHDGIVMKRVIDDLNKTQQPFFTTWLTLSSHEPFETPVPVVIKGGNPESKFLNSLNYTDQVMGQFISECSKQSWWDNTLLVITGDHGHPMPANGSQLDNFRTPMLWLGGALKQKGITIDKVMSQTDIAAMIAQQTGHGQQSKELFPFSKNSLNHATKAWSFFTFNNGFGFVDSTGRLLFDNVGKQVIERNGLPGDAQVNAGKAMMQYVFQDFVDR